MKENGAAMTAMKRWDEGVQEDHQALESQVGALEAALGVDVTPQDRRVVLSWILRGLWPSLELHLRKEEEVLFPALQQLLGESAGAVTLLKEQHRELRAALRHLAELLQEPQGMDWPAVKLASQAFTELLEDHEAKEERLLLHVLEAGLKPKELKELAAAFHHVTQKAVLEEGWPTGWPTHSARELRHHG